MVDVSKRLVEVDEVLKYLNVDELKKIPEEIRQMIKANKDKDYVWEYDENKKLKNQNLSRDTFAFLSYLNMEYLLNEEQKKLMNQIHMENERKEEEIKSEKYKTDDLFKKNTNKIETKSYQNDLEIVEYKETIFRRVINKIKKFFGINSK